MAIDLQELIRIDAIKDDLLEQQDIQLDILRLDEIHPIVSGNKWFKLKYNIADAIENGHDSVLTFGGAHSNHLIAAAAAAKVFGLRSVGIIRGFHGKEKYTDTLHACEEMGMQLHFTSREDYNRKEEENFWNALQMEFGKCYIIPEGGNDVNGRKGTAEISNYIPDAYTHVALAIGTGATFAGIRASLNDNIQMLGFTVMKGGMYLKEEIRQSLPESKVNWSIVADYHFGGFAKSDDDLIAFMNHFYTKHSVPLDQVYNAKLLSGVMDLIKNNAFPKGSKVLCVHTGGLQGNNSIKNKLLF